jgi:uncharacterized protein YciI
MFIVLLKYIKPLEKINEVLPAHIEFLKKCYKDSKFIVSGPRSPRTGGVILANVNSETELRDLLKQDPFYIHEAAEYEVIAFTPTKYDESFSCFVR